MKNSPNPIRNWLSGRASSNRPCIPGTSLFFSSPQYQTISPATEIFQSSTYDPPRAARHRMTLFGLAIGLIATELSPGRGNSPGEGTQPNGNNDGESQKVTGGSRDLNSIHNPMTGLRITPT